MSSTMVPIRYIKCHNCHHELFRIVDNRYCDALLICERCGLMGTIEYLVDIHQESKVEETTENQ